MVGDVDLTDPKQNELIPSGVFKGPDSIQEKEVPDSGPEGVDLTDPAYNELIQKN
jgi:hypothetical protein